VSAFFPAGSALDRFVDVFQDAFRASRLACENARCSRTLCAAVMEWSHLYR